MDDDLLDDRSDTDEEHLAADIGEPNLDLGKEDGDDGLHGEEHIALTPPG